MFARVYSLNRVQEFPVSRRECWRFFSNPLNLPTITPPWLRFQPLDLEFTETYAGLILQYRVAPLFGIPMRWVTEITHVDHECRFVDEQRFGPYLFWHHQHHFEDIENGTRMTDIVHYALPLGPIGWLMHWLTVRRQLQQIFDYRFNVMVERFGKLEPASAS